MATLGHLPTRGLGLSSHLAPRVSPNLHEQQRPRGPLLTRGGIQYWSKHFSHPEVRHLTLRHMSRVAYDFVYN